MIRVVADTNVLVSAIRRGTTTRKVSELWVEGRIRLVVSREIIQEYLRVLSYPKLELSSQEVRQVMEEMVLPYADLVERVPPLSHSTAGVEKDDMKFLACAAAGGARYLITGDKGFLRTGEYRSVELIAPASFLEKVFSR